MEQTRPLKLRDDELAWRSIQGEVVALDLGLSRYLAVNRSGAVLWKALADGTDRMTLVDLLVETFGRERASAESDVDAFIRALDKQRLLR